ncbi:T-cell surface glycoprotein CD8 alpha chain-like isoform X2 [Pseudophryne corroboree]|uniref:T-cell surface glycoprotein CD8 alpha chain-like isoform X2 n=1 Tax=Pseudophryne corroboree TaxID=495146 RepID=UPI0030821A0F
MVCHIMATLISLLILLCLFSCSHQLKLKGPEVTSVFSGPVRLECEPDRGDLMDFGVFWFRQRKDAKNPESIVFLSNTRKAIYSADQGRNGFLADKTGSTYTLTITSFGQTFQATYYCMINKNSVLYISPGLPLLYPEVTTRKPTTTKEPAPEISTKGKGDGCNCFSGKQGTRRRRCRCKHRPLEENNGKLNAK